MRFSTISQDMQQPNCHESTYPTQLSLPGRRTRRLLVMTGEAKVAVLLLLLLLFRRAFLVPLDLRLCHELFENEEVALLNTR